MFSWGIWALVIAIIAGVLGFTGIAGTATFFAQIVFGIGLLLFIVSLFVGRKAVR